MAEPPVYMTPVRATQSICIWAVLVDTPLVGAAGFAGSVCKIESKLFTKDGFERPIMFIADTLIDIGYPVVK